MKAEVKKQWIDALESGEYLQTTGCLLEQQGNGDCAFCAVGVLVDLYVRSHNAEWQFDADDEFGYMNGYYMTMPPEVIEWAGISRDELGIIEFGDNSVVHLNDNEQESFEAIAGFIEENL